MRAYERNIWKFFCVFALIMGIGGMIAFAGPGTKTAGQESGSHVESGYPAQIYASTILNVTAEKLKAGSDGTHTLSLEYRQKDGGVLKRAAQSYKVTGNAGASSPQWKQTDGKWWFDNGDGSYPADGWKQINDAWYYFDANGYMLSNQWVEGAYYLGADGAMLVNTTTPDGYRVGADGAWVQD